jgi:hypothetical protein
MRPKHAERGTRLGRFPCALLVGLNFALFAFVPGAVHAADDDATLSMARERFKEGVQYFDQELYDKARAAFVQAYALRKHPAVLLNLAQSEVRSGHEADAATHFAQYLREHKEATEAERQGAMSGLATAKAAVMEVPVDVDADGAEVLIDQTLQGTSPLPQPLYLAPGRHTILARKEGREDSVQVDAVAGQSTTVTLRLRRPKQEAAPRPAATEAAQAEPLEDEPVSEATATVESKGFFAWAADSPVAWIGGGLTLAGIAGGIGFGLGAADSYDSADSVLARIRQEATGPNGDGLTSTQGLCSDPAAALMRAPTLKVPLDQRAADYEKACSRYSDNIDSGDSLKTLSTVSWVVAGVAAAGTIVYYFIDTSGTPSSASRKRGLLARTRFVPYVSAGERGFAITGEF